eukprot:gene10748-3368_t
MFLKKITAFNISSNTTQKSTYVTLKQTKTLKFEQICQQENWMKAEKYFQKLPLEEKNNQNFHILLKNFANQKEYRKLEEYFDLMIKSNIKPIPHTFTILHKSFIGVDIFKNRNYFKMMNSYNYTPSTRLATKYISNCYKNRLPKMAEEFDEMFGHKLDRDSIYFNFLIQGCVDNLNINKAIEYFGKMIQLEVSPDIFTFTLLIKGYLAINDYETAKKLLDEMKDLNIKPNVVTYGQFLDSFTSNFDQKKIDEILEMMKKENIKFNETINTILIKLYLDQDQYKKAIDIFENEKTKNSYYLNLFIHYFAEKGDLGEMNYYFKLFKELNLQPDSITFGTLIKGYVKKGQFEEAEKILTENHNSKIPVTSKTVGFIMKGYCESLLVKKAENLLSRYESYGLKLDPESLTYLMKCYYDLKEPQKGRKCFLMMRHQQMKPTIYTYLLRFLGEFQNHQTPITIKKSFQDLLSKSELNKKYSTNRK